jgi:hypothetical protein
MAIILPQAIAPAFVTSLFAFSIQSGIAGGNLTWIILFAFSTFLDLECRYCDITLMLFKACAAALHGMTLKEPENAWRKDIQHQ